MTAVRSWSAHAYLGPSLQEQSLQKGHWVFNKYFISDPTDIFCFVLFFSAISHCSTQVERMTQKDHAGYQHPVSQNVIFKK